MRKRTDEEVAALVDGVIRMEGGYSDDPADRGGETNMGITKAVARSHGYAGAMRELPRAEAERIYRESYWLAPRFDRLPAPLDALAFDWGVNSGPRTAAKELQALLNERARACGRSLGIPVDGVVGPRTVLAACAAAASGGFKGLCAAYLRRRRRFLERIVERRPGQAKFLRGWLRRVDLLEAAHVGPMPDPAEGEPF